MTHRLSLVAIGRSRLLYDTLVALAHDFRIRAIVTDVPNAEYDVGVGDFQHLADDLGCAFRQARTLDPATVAFLANVVRTHRVTAGISVNWRFVIPGSVLDLFSRGLLNLHLGNLPDYKGNATVNWSILAGEEHIFANVHTMVAALDAGDILAREAIPITPSTYVGDILAATEALAPALFRQALVRAHLDPPQIELAGSTDGLRCFPRRPEDGLIDWSQTADQVCRLVRASSHPFPGAFSHLDGERVTVWRARVATDPGRVLAVPGQVLAADGVAGTLQVACGTGSVHLELAERGGEVLAPTDLTRSIRSRFSTRVGS